MSLREGAVKALWSYCGGSAEDALDALCDYLTEHADEWKAASHERLAGTDPDVFGAAALAALARGDTREDTE